LIRNLVILLFISIFLIKVEVKAQFFIPHVLVIHTKSNSDYFQVCLNPNCVDNARKAKINRGLKRKRNRQMAKKNREKDAQVKRRERNGNQKTIDHSISHEPKFTESEEIVSGIPKDRNTTLTVEEPKVAEINKEVIIHKVRAFEWVYFDTDKWTLSDSGKLELLLMVKYLSVHSNLRIKIFAHTDNLGTDEYNMKLSEHRAETVVEYLITLGLANNRIKWKALGASKPITSNTSETNKALNRRVEYMLY